MKDPLKGFIIAVTGDFGTARSPENMKRWVTANGGQWATSVTEKTTHLICSKDHWQKNVNMVKIAKMERDCKIVSYDWLEDCLMDRARKREGPYLLQKLEQDKKKAKEKQNAKERLRAKQDVVKFNKGCDSARSDLNSGTSDLTSWKDALLEHAKDETRALAASEAMKKYKATLKKSKSKASSKSNIAAKKSTKPKPAGILSKPPLMSEGDSEPKLAPAKIPPEHAVYVLSEDEDDESHGDGLGDNSPGNTSSASVASSGSSDSTQSRQWCPQADQRASSELGNHHIYRDRTGFDYDITLMRINTSANTNERYQLRLYESHTYPHTYATHLRYTQSSRLPKNQTLSPIGSDYETAFSAFKKAFRGKTRLYWEERLDQDAVLRRRVYDEGEGGTFGGLDGGGVGPASFVGGTEVSSQTTVDHTKQVNGKDMTVFDVRVLPFTYIPPPEGKPRGVMPGFEIPKDRMWNWEEDGCLI